MPDGSNILCGLGGVLFWPGSVSIRNGVNERRLHVSIVTFVEQDDENMY